jgi:hypothetical protein
MAAPFSTWHISCITEYLATEEALRESLGVD